MNRAHHLILVVAAVMGLLALGALLDVPSEEQLELAVAADLQDAIEQARRDAPEVRRELARLEAEDYPRITPLTPEQMRRVAMLEGRQ